MSTPVKANSHILKVFTSGDDFIFDGCSRLDIGWKDDDAFLRFTKADGSQRRIAFSSLGIFVYDSKTGQTKSLRFTS
ncbi:hypothetical protein [Faecalibaculum rodentium]|uniref:hypothetical protein n=1 Tax=Faecalibaculum rodentium TaxID=1702221 RepID=UPI0025B73D45|nr:hypothetical protein [Faecalibaculum rodentium]